MVEEYDRVLDVVAENPGATVEELADLARDRGVTDTDLRELLSEAVNNEDVVEFDGRYWVMRTGEYRFNRYDHPET